MEPSVQKEASTKTHSFEVPTELGAKDDVWDAANRQLEQPSGSQGNQSKVQAFPAMMLSPCPREPSDSEALLRAINSSKGRSALSSESAFEYFSGADIGPHLNEIVEDDGSNRGVWGRIISILTCSSSIRNPVLLNERRRIFCYAKIPFDNEDDVHFRCASARCPKRSVEPFTLWGLAPRGLAPFAGAQ